MEHDIGKLKELYLERISLYEKLLGCVRKESDNLVTQNIKGIWTSLEEKKGIIEAIEENNKSFPEGGRSNPVPVDISRDEKEAISQSRKKLNSLRQEIGVRVSENASFINDTLSFINDIFSAFGSKEKKSKTYGPGMKKKNGHTNLIYHSEV